MSSAAAGNGKLELLHPAQHVTERAVMRYELPVGLPVLHPAGNISHPGEVSLFLIESEAPHPHGCPARDRQCFMAGLDDVLRVVVRPACQHTRGCSSGSCCLRAMAKPVRDEKRVTTVCR